MKRMNPRTMITSLNKPIQFKQLVYALAAVLLVFLTSCSHEEPVEPEPVATASVEPTRAEKHETLHPYGGWSCPDNLRGFPAVDLQELAQVPVVNGRLPTQEETRNGTSLMFFEPMKTPGARPLDMKMPRVARYYSTYTKKAEVVVVIQAVEADNDTVVGFRYLNGGNGSAWFDQVTFLSDEEVAELGPTPFVSHTVPTHVSSNKAWDVITNPDNAEILGNLLAENATLESDWKLDSKVELKRADGSVASTGTVTASWPNSYLQIDYNMDGQHYVEKFLFYGNGSPDTTYIQVVTGPHDDDFEAKQAVWQNWLQKVKELSEA